LQPLVQVTLEFELKSNVLERNSTAVRVQPDVHVIHAIIILGCEYF